MAQKDALIEGALVNQDSALARTAEGLQCAERLVQQKSQEIQQYQQDLQTHASKVQQKDQVILQLQTQMAAVEAKQAEYSSMQAKLEQSAAAKSTPIFDSSQRQKDVEEIRELQAEKAATLSDIDKQKSLSKLEGDKERKKSSKMEEEMHLQFELL